MRHADAELQLWLANDRIAREQHEVEMAHLVRARSETPTIRQRAGQAFIAQEHPEGRVTFIDTASGLVRTITGFELGASVVVWSRDGGP